MNKKIIAMMTAMVMLFGVVVGGTVAWLQAKSLEVNNTFTFGKIEIDIDETDNEDDDTSTKNNAYDLIPGEVSQKDPKVTVIKGSEKCYVYVKVTELNNKFDTNKDVIVYSVDSKNWKVVDATKGIYVYTNGTSQAYAVDALAENVETKLILAEVLDASGQPIANKHIRVNSELDESDIKAMTDANTLPKITFKACAVQSEHITMAEADSTAITLLSTP